MKPECQAIIEVMKSTKRDAEPAKPSNEDAVSRWAEAAITEAKAELAASGEVVDTETLAWAALSKTGATPV